MNPNEQAPDQILRALLPLRIEPVAESVREKACYRALVAFRNAPPVAKPRNQIFKWLLLLTSVAALILVTTFVMKPASLTGRDNSKLFSEVENMFEGKLIAAIKDGDSLDLRIADSSAPLAMDQRILLTLKKGSHLIQVLTYSGREIRLSLNGRPVMVTPLVSGDGSILLVTDHNLLTGNRNSEIDGFSFKAKAINGKQS
jgi:hypothetical protein